MFKSSTNWCLNCVCGDRRRHKVPKCLITKWAQLYYGVKRYRRHQICFQDAVKRGRGEEAKAAENDLGCLARSLFGLPARKLLLRICA